MANGVAPATSKTYRSLTSRGRALLAFVLVAAMIAFVAACQRGGPPPQASGDTSSASASDNEPHLWLNERGDKRAFENGDAVSIDGMQVEIFVSPYPPARAANIDFYVTRGGDAVEDANVTLQYDMTVMDHGPFELLAAPTGRGHYLAPVDFIMSGDFWLNVAVSAGDGGESVINLLVRTRR